MSTQQPALTKRQLIFAELAAGTLIYAVVLGLFDDYTDLVEAKSFSTIVFASILLEALTFLTFLFKDWWLGFLTRWLGALSRPRKLFGLWLVMFFSKFVFLWALEFVFQGNFEVGGFFSVLILVACVTVLAKIGNAFFVRLGAPDGVLN